MAHQLNVMVGPAGPVYAYQPGFLPILFYLHPSAQYVRRIENLPAAVNYLLVYAPDDALAERQLRDQGIAVSRAATLDHLSRGNVVPAAPGPRNRFIAREHRL